MPQRLPRIQIGVIGPSGDNLPKNKIKARDMLVKAEDIGELLAKANVIVITGGQDGVMEAVCRGAKKFAGITVGTPGRKRISCNPFIDIEVCTPIDVGDYLFAGLLSCDCIIVFPGGAGTLAELALGYRFKIPMIIFRGFNEWYDRLIGRRLDATKKLKFYGASSPAECVGKAIRLARSRLKNQGGKS